MSDDNQCDAYYFCSSHINSSLEESVGSYASIYYYKGGSGLSNESMERLHSTLESAEKSLNHIQILLQEDLNSGSFSSSVTGAFAGAILAYIFTITHWRTVRKKEKVDSVRKSMADIVGRISSTSYSYWMKDFSTISEKECELVMQTLFKPLYAYMTFIKNANSNFFNFFFQKYFNLNIGAFKECDSILNAIYDVFDMATGDDFLASERARDEKKAKAIVNACQSLMVKVNCIG